MQLLVHKCFLLVQHFSPHPTALSLSPRACLTLTVGSIVTCRLLAPQICIYDTDRILLLLKTLLRPVSKNEKLAQDKPFQIDGNTLLLLEISSEGSQQQNLG